LLENYRIFLAPKTDYWRKAKQYEFKDLDRIVLALQNLDHYTTRNSISLRILGLVKNLGGDKLELTAAGQELLGSENKQTVLDEQLLKIYLDSEINNRLNIPVFPLEIIYSLLSQLDYITFQEYELFICWIDDSSQIKVVAKLIEDFRETNEDLRQRVIAIHTEKAGSLGTQDIEDNLGRLFDMIALSSFVNFDGTRPTTVIYKNSSSDTYQKLAALVSKVSTDEYLEDDFKYLQLISFPAEHQELTNAIQNLSNEQRSTVAKIIESAVKERDKLPDLSKVKPTIVDLQIKQTEPSGSSKSGKNPSKFKPDYSARENTNRLVGLHAENIVLKNEFDQLISAGKINLANNIEHISTIDDSVGYDIKSFNVDSGSEKHIEVKAVSGLRKSFRFFISQNELDKAQNDPHYHIYIVFDYRSENPKIWPMPNIFKQKDNRVQITPIKYLVEVSIETQS
jgi:hypothetical protein